MHETQLKLLELSRSHNLAKMPLRKIGSMIGLGDNNARLVQHHIDQLVNKGFLWIDRKSGSMKLLAESDGGAVLRIPIYGSANCGPAAQIADNTIEGYLSLSPQLFNLKGNKEYFALRAVGSSMNKAKVKTFGGQYAGIDDGDTIVVEKALPADVNSKPYIVAVIDGLANIKRLVIGNSVVKLESESTSRHMPIYLTPDVENFICGVVVAVVKP